ELVLPGDVVDFVLDFLVVDLDVKFLHLLRLQVLVDQGAQGLLLDRRQVLFGRLHAGGGDQQQHSLAQVVGGDDLVVDEGDHALGQSAPLRRLSGRLGGAWGGRLRHGRQRRGLGRRRRRRRQGRQRRRTARRRHGWQGGLLHLPD